MPHISYSQLMLPGLRLSKKYGEKLWKIGKDHLRDLEHKSCLPKEHFNELLKTLVSKLEEPGASPKNLVSVFRKCGLYPFNQNVVYEKLPSENVMGPQEALDQSLLQQFQCMRESPVGKDAQQNKKRTRLDVAPGKSISNLDFVFSESDSGSETESGPEPEPEESDIEENDDADDEQQVITLSDIRLCLGEMQLFSFSQVLHRRMHGERK